MNNEDTDRFRAIMLRLGEYYDQEITDGKIDLFWLGLVEYDIEAIEAAARTHLRNAEKGQFFPRVSDFVRMLDGTQSDRASLAWTKVHGAVKSIGPYQTLVFDDPIIHLVLSDMGGFSLLCDTLTDEMPFKAKEFENRYRAYASRPSLPNHQAKIIGIVEAENSAKGLPEFIPQPTLVGDPHTATEVLRLGNQSAKPMAISLGEHLKKIGALTGQNRP